MNEAFDLRSLQLFRSSSIENRSGFLPRLQRKLSGEPISLDSLILPLAASLRSAPECADENTGFNLRLSREQFGEFAVR